MNSFGGFGVLSLCTFFPLVGALLIAVQNREAKTNARWIALYTTLFTLGVALWIWAHFDYSSAASSSRRR
jgi:NADH-quinone oxidoreductase subunit M